MMNINKMMTLLQKAKDRGMTEIGVWFDTEARKFDYHMAEVGSFYLQPDWLDTSKSFEIHLHELDERPVRYPHDSRLEPGGMEMNGWGFWNKEYTQWYGPWDDFRDAEKEMSAFDAKVPSTIPHIVETPVYGDIGIVENNISASLKEGSPEFWASNLFLFNYLTNAQKEIKAFWQKRADEETAKNSKPEA